MFKRIDHTALNVSDLDKSVAFYEKHFGFKFYYMDEVGKGIKIAYLKLGNTILELLGYPKGEYNGFHFALEVEGFDEAIEKLQHDGVNMNRKPHPTAAREPREDGWRRAEFLGPDGEIIEIRGK